MTTTTTSTTTTTTNDTTNLETPLFFMYTCYRHNILHYLTCIWSLKNDKENKSVNCSILI